MPAQKRELGLHRKVGELLLWGRRVADDVGIGLREVVRERDDPPLPCGCRIDRGRKEARQHPQVNA